MEAGTLGRETDLVEALARSTRIGPEDTRTDVNVNLFRRMQTWRQRPDRESAVALLAQSAVKPEIGNLALAALLRELGVTVPTTNLRVLETTTGRVRFLDVPAVPASDVTLEVLVLRGDEVVTENRVLRANEATVFEVKMFAADTWVKSPKAAGDEVLRGFQFVDPGAGGAGNSLLATTPDILTAPTDTLRKVLKNILALRDPRFDGRSAVFLLPRDNNFYKEAAFGILRRLID